MEQLAGILPLLLIFVVFYFLLIRPQQKKLKDHKNMIANLKKGDRIVTQGGIIGNIHYVNDDGTLSVDCLLYTSPSPRDQRGSRMPSSA